jgi:hypothetical protein
VNTKHLYVLANTKAMDFISINGTTLNVLFPPTMLKFPDEGPGFSKVRNVIFRRSQVTIPNYTSSPIICNEFQLKFYTFACYTGNFVKRSLTFMDDLYVMVCGKIPNIFLLASTMQVMKVNSNRYINI